MKKLLTTLFAVALGLSLSAQTACPPAQDANQDGVIGVDDLMDLLSHWGDTDFDFDGVYDSVDLCTDEGACNYLSNPTEACLYLDAIGACGGDCAEDTDGDGVCDEFYGPCQGQSTVTYQDYTYDLVAIGEQCWFAENLRNEYYANGDAIPGELSDSLWNVTSYGAQAIYNNDTSNLAVYGRLYSWYAVDDSRGVCPIGWHVPTDVEYTVLTDYLGGQNVAGDALKSAPTDSPSWNGTNESGFSALAAGYRFPWGSFHQAGVHTDIWTSTLNSSVSSWARIIWGHSAVSREAFDKDFGFSVRCIKDTEE